MLLRLHPSVSLRDRTCSLVFSGHPAPPRSPPVDSEAHELRELGSADNYLARHDSEVRQDRRRSTSDGLPLTLPGELHDPNRYQRQHPLTVVHCRPFADTDKCG